MKTDHFESCGHCWQIFQICWHTECSTLTTLSFRIWNGSAGIPSPPLALFAVMLLKTHSTSHPRMRECEGSRWGTTPSWLSGSLRFFPIFLLFLPPLLNLVCFFNVLTASVLYHTHLCMECSLGISNCLEEISSLSHFSTVHLRRPFYLSWLFSGTLHSVGYISSFLPCFSLLFFLHLL